ncbi:MAG: sporulation protein YtxC [Bacillota bacterium]
MEIISIGTVRSAAGIRADLTQEMESLHGHGLSLRFNQSDRGIYSLLHCHLEEVGGEDGEGRNRVLRYYLANTITDLILNVVTREMLARLLARDYACFNSEERESILREALALLEEPLDPAFPPPRIIRRDRILGRVLRYLEDHDQLILEGFVRFQLKEYYAELKEAVDRAVERFLARREYEEFIRLLRYLVELQPARLEELNVRIEEDGVFVLLDEEGRPVEHEQLRSLLAETGEEIDHADLLLSTLVTIAPARVVLHVRKPFTVVETIGRVFGPRMLICPGCPLCPPGVRAP